jgi:hypothetical protein
MWPLCMDHFLVVSRTRLPINFQPFHEGGSPDTWGDVLTRPFSLSNQELILWIKKQYEQIRLQQKIKNLPVAVQWLNFQGAKLFQRILGTVTGYSLISLMSKQELQRANFKDYQGLLKSRPFSDKFWNDRIVTCPNCTSQNKTNKNFNFQDFLLHRQHGQFRISSEDLNPILMSGKWSCNQCGFEFQIIQEPHPQFRWWSIRWNRPTGPNDVFIEQIPIYSLQKI